MRSIFAAALVVSAAASAAEGDKDGCRDHPLLPSRLPGYVIESCDSNGFSAQEFAVTGRDPVTLEGKKTVLHYTLVDGKKGVSELFVGRNYEQALVKIGGKPLSQRPVTVKLEKGGQELWVGVSGYLGEGSPEEMGGYVVTVVEKGQMEQVVTAADIFGELQRTGRVALYVQFDTAKATVKPESQALLAQMAKALSDNAALEVYVVGHTDTQGALEANLKLSSDRAESVVKALVAKGIAAKRLAAKGVGPLSPLANNDTEAGRQQNRRVELVKR